MSIVSSAESGKKGDVQSFERIQQIDYSNAKKGRLIAASLAGITKVLLIKPINVVCLSNIA